MKSNEICKNCKYHYMEEISFDYPQSCCKKTNPNHTTEEWFHCDCFEYSKNYITNLQQKSEQLENIRKEAIEYMKEFIFEPLLINEDRKLIMFNENLKNFENILNKGSDQE